MFRKDSISKHLNPEPVVKRRSFVQASKQKFALDIENLPKNSVFNLKNYQSLPIKLDHLKGVQSVQTEEVFESVLLDNNEAIDSMKDIKSICETFSLSVSVENSNSVDFNFIDEQRPFSDKEILKQRKYYHSKYYNISDLSIFWNCAEIVLIGNVNAPSLDKSGRIRADWKSPPTIYKNQDPLDSSMNAIIWTDGSIAQFEKLISPKETLIVFCIIAQEQYPYYLKVIGFDILLTSTFDEVVSLIAT